MWKVWLHEEGSFVESLNNLMLLLVLNNGGEKQEDGSWASTIIFVGVGNACAAALFHKMGVDYNND